MGDLMLTGLSEDVMARLAQRAADHGRSVEAEAAEIVALELARASAKADPRTADLVISLPDAAAN